MHLVSRNGVRMAKITDFELESSLRCKIQVKHPETVPDFQNDIDRLLHGRRGAMFIIYITILPRHRSVSLLSLAHEEPLLLQAPLVLATRTSQAHLSATNLAGV